jgi:hypothetical protein
MVQHEILLRQAVEGMVRRFPNFYDEGVVSRLMTDKSMPNREEMLLAALVKMVDRCLDRYEDRIETFEYGVTALYGVTGTPDAVAAWGIRADEGLLRPLFKLGARRLCRSICRTGTGDICGPRGSRNACEVRANQFPPRQSRK